MPELSFVFWSLAAITFIFFIVVLVELFTKTLTKATLYDFLTGCVYLVIIYAFEMKLVSPLALIVIIIFIVFDLVIIGCRAWNWWKRKVRGA